MKKLILSLRNQLYALLIHCTARLYLSLSTEGKEQSRKQLLKLTEGENHICKEVYDYHRSAVNWKRKNDRPIRKNRKPILDDLDDVGSPLVLKSYPRWHQAASDQEASKQSAPAQ